MRNLKRVLSLALALVMVLGMMVIGTSAATFTDAEEITYKEAVDVMSAIGIITGNPDGSFNPKGELSREGAAKILAFICLGADADNYLSGSEAPFEDVKADRWSAKYVSYCKNLGIIDGVTPTTFNPKGNISTVGFGKLLLGAIGIECEDTGAGWENNVKKALEDADLDVVTIDRTDITREEACEMALAAMKYTGESSGYVVKKGTTVLKKFAEITDAIIYCATLKTADQANAADYSYAVAPATSYLLNATYGVTFDALTAKDEFGRPGIRYTKGNSINLFFADEPAFTFVNSFTKEVADEMEDAEYVLTDGSIVYNGYTTTPDEINTVAELYSGAQGNPAVNGYTIEMYNTDDNAKTIEKIVVIESNFAVVKTVTETEGTTPGSVVLTVYWNRNTTDVTYTDSLTSTNDQYDALVGYAEGTALVVTLAEGWNASTPAKLLNVAVPTAVPGTIAKKFVGTKYTTCTLTIADETYALNNNFSHAMGNSGLMPGDEGTLYLDAQGKAIGWTDKAGPAPAAETLVYVNDVYSRTDKVVNQYTGASSDVITYWAQCIDLTGAEVVYQVTQAHYGQFPGTLALGKIYAVVVDEDVDNRGTANDTTDDVKADYATFSTSNNTVNDATITADDGLTTKDIKIAANNYFTSDVKFIFVNGAKNTLNVKVLDGVQALDKNQVVCYVTAKITGDDANKTVPVVFVEKKWTPGSSAVTGTGIMFIANGTSKTSVSYTDKDGNAKIGYEYNVYVDGVLTTIVVADADGSVTSGFVTYSVDNGVYTITGSDSATNLKASTDVTNMYNGMLSTGDVTDMAVAGATLIDVSGDRGATTDATKLTAEYDVALVLSTDGKSIVTIYITDYTKAQ